VYWDIARLTRGIMTLTDVRRITTALDPSTTRYTASGTGYRHPLALTKSGLKVGKEVPV